MNNRTSRPRRFNRSRHAFTLVEVLVALGILAILLVIIVLPLRLGFDSFNQGNARTLTQSALQATMTDMENDLRQAVYVFPNSRVPGITNQAPYTDDPAGTSGSAYDARLPYYLSTDADDTTEPGTGGAGGDPQGIACGDSKSWSNPARVDMIQVRRDANGNVLTPLAPSYNIVTYYARRQQLDKPYDAIDNPVVMYRAEYPAFGLVTATGAPAPLQVDGASGGFNAQIDFKRIKRAASPTGQSIATSAVECTAAGNAGATNRSSLWLSHNVYGEADLLPLTNLGNDTDADAAMFDPAAGFATAGSTYSHKLAIPRGLALEASNAFRIDKGDFAPVTTTANTPDAPLMPDTSFTTTDTNGDGKIDQVTISLGLASYDVGAQGQLKNNQPIGAVLRSTRTVNLPNVK